MKEIVIFCQAPADIQYALSIYDRYRSEGKFHFFAINVKGMYKFLTELELKNVDVEFIPYPDLNIKNPKSIIQVKKYIKNNIKRYFSDMKNCDVYYFSNTFDWLTYAFIAKLTNRNNVFNCDHYAKVLPYKRDNSISIKKTLILFIYLCFTKVWFHFECIKGNRVVSFDPGRHGVVEIEIPISKDIYIKYVHPIETNRLRKNILFFETDLSNTKMISNYDKSLKEIIDCFINAEFNIYIKPHPRLGYTRLLEDWDVRILPEYVPGEFICIDGLSAIIGVLSTSIGVSSKYWDVPTYSILDLFDFYDVSKKENYRTVLTKRSNGNLKFIHNINELEKICLDLSKNEL